MPTLIKFDVRRNISSIGGFDPDDEWSRDSTIGDVEILGASIVGGDGYDVLDVQSELFVGDKIYLVWAEYTTGDSFGSDGGQYELLQVCCNSSEANERMQYFNIVSDYTVPWTGYFETLDGIFIDEFILQ